jgi:hypothetical protein
MEIKAGYRAPCNRGSAGCLGFCRRSSRRAALASTRTWVIKALRERYQSDVQLKNLTVTLLPHPRVSGEGLVLQSSTVRAFLHSHLSNGSLLKPTCWDSSITLGTSAI